MNIGVKLTGNKLVMVKFTWQLVVLQCPDFWSNIILDASVRGCFWTRLTFKLVNFEESKLPTINMVYVQLKA